MNKRNYLREIAMERSFQDKVWESLCLSVIKWWKFFKRQFACFMNLVWTSSSYFIKWWKICDNLHSLRFIFKQKVYHWRRKLVFLEKFHLCNFLEITSKVVKLKFIQQLVFKAFNQRFPLPTPKTEMWTLFKQYRALVGRQVKRDGKL